MSKCFSFRWRVVVKSLFIETVFLLYAKGERSVSVDVRLRYFSLSSTDNIVCE